MDGEIAPTTAAPANGTEATPTTNSNPAPASEPASAPEQAAPTQSATDPNAWLQGAPEEFRRFVESNGYEKAFDKFKQAVSAPAQRVQPQPQPQPQMEAQPTPRQEAPAQAPQPTPSSQGFITQQEINTKLYFDSVAAQPEYANIAGDIRSGEIFNQMRSLGVNPFSADGSINAMQLKSFLDMYAKTKPAHIPTPIEGSTAPTNNFTQVKDGGITSQAEALKIFSEPNNPNHQAAVEWLKKNRADVMKNRG